MQSSTPQASHPHSCPSQGAGVAMVIGYEGPQPVVAAGRAGYRLGSDRGSPNHGSTLASKRVMAQTWPPARVST